MAYNLDEQDQLDQLRAWWAKYGTAVLTALIVVLAVLGGWRGWQWYQTSQATQARGYFEALEDASRQSGDEASARISAAMQTLRTDFAATDYAARGALVAATALAARNDLAAARQQLEWLTQTKNTTLLPVAKLRLAGILLEQKEFDAALTQLNEPPAAFAGLYADRRGDVLSAQGKTAGAREAWTQALEALGATSPLTPVVKLKLDALGA
ncbi:MAG: tetratricopeptide repeat protein [Alcaligenaceae bacterium]|nr:tetratricopeptide repeat protein [Alcaligenaceae bacterium]